MRLYPSSSDYVPAASTPRHRPCRLVRRAWQDWRASAMPAAKVGNPQAAAHLFRLLIQRGIRCWRHTIWRRCRVGRGRGDGSEPLLLEWLAFAGESSSEGCDTWCTQGCWPQRCAIRQGLRRLRAINSPRLGSRSPATCWKMSVSLPRRDRIVICHTGQVVAFNPGRNVSDWVAYRGRVSVPTLKIACRLRLP